MIKGGQLLTPEQSQRLAILDSVDREALVAAIASRLRLAHQELSQGTTGGDSPDHLWRFINGVPE